MFDLGVFAKDLTNIEICAILLKYQKYLEIRQVGRVLLDPPSYKIPNL